jgi:hypothetical protein
MKKTLVFGKGKPPSKKHLHHRSYQFCELDPPAADASGEIRHAYVDIPIRNRRDAVRVIKAAWAYGKRNNQELRCEVNKLTKTEITVWRMR